MNFIQTLSSSDNTTIALLATMVLALSGVVAFQWNYTTTKTVPKWVWDALMPKIESIAETQKTLTTIIDERLKK